MTLPLIPPDPIPGIFDSAAVIAWLRTLPIPDIPLVAGAIAVDIPNMPNRLAVVTATGPGAGGLDGREIIPRFQLRVRGDTDQPLDAERLAWQFDTAIDRADLPANVNGVRVLTVGWAGNGPQGITATSGRRPESSCTYLFRIIRP